MTESMADPLTGSVADRRAFLEGGLRDLACEHCGGKVRVKKTSPQQTSVQWTRQAVSDCAEFALRAAPDRPSALIATCTRLRDSIERAAREGRIGPA
jgi:hypothetical protein